MDNKYYTKTDIAIKLIPNLNKSIVYDRLKDLIPDGEIYKHRQAYPAYSIDSFIHLFPEMNQKVNMNDIKDSINELNKSNNSLVKRQSLLIKSLFKYLDTKTFEMVMESIYGKTNSDSFWLQIIKE